MSISVIMSVFNGSAYLEQSLRSVLEQNKEDFEFLIANDGSTDNSLDILEDYASRDKRIKLYNQKNIGLTKTLNSLIDKSKYEIIARQDADDICLPDRFSQQYAFLQQNKDHVLVGSNAQLIDEGNNLIKITNLPLSNIYLRNRLLISNSIIHSSIMAKKEAIISVGGYDESIPYAQDYDLWLRVTVKKKFKISNLKESLIKLRIHGSSISASKKELQDLCAAFALYRIKENSLFQQESLDNLKKLRETSSSFRKIYARQSLIRRDLRKAFDAYQDQRTLEAYFFRMILSKFI